MAMADFFKVVTAVKICAFAAFAAVAFCKAVAVFLRVLAVVSVIRGLAVLK